MTDTGEVERRWAVWFDALLTERGIASVDVTKASGVKSNGRPVIDQSRMTAWRGHGKRGPERPKYEMVQLLARILEVDPYEMLLAAGYVGPRPLVPGEPLPARSELTIEADSPEQKAAMIAYQEILRRNAAG